MPYFASVAGAVAAESVVVAAESGVDTVAVVSGAAISVFALSVAALEFSELVFCLQAVIVAIPIATTVIMINGLIFVWFNVFLMNYPLYTKKFPR